MVFLEPIRRRRAPEVDQDRTSRVLFDELVIFLSRSFHIGEKSTMPQKTS
jgi:hypothetical protein